MATNSSDGSGRLQLSVEQQPVDTITERRWTADRRAAVDRRKRDAEATRNRLKSTVRIIGDAGADRAAVRAYYFRSFGDRRGGGERRAGPGDQTPAEIDLGTIGIAATILPATATSTTTLPATSRPAISRPATEAGILTSEEVALLLGTRETPGDDG